MKIVIIGGGPAGLYFALLMKKADRAHQITVYERNRADDTFGFGVVFSDETLGNFREADPESYHQIVDNFAYWDQIDVHFQGQVTRSGGHGFCGLSRQKLLGILQARCAGLGVELQYEAEIDDLERFAHADLLVGADGANSLVRERYKEHFRPSLDWRKNKFVWLGSTLPLDAFTFFFRESEHGLFRVHAYQYEAKHSTFIVECTEETWRKAGLDKAGEADTVAYCEALFAPDLGGHRLLTNMSLWRTFPTVRNQRWYHDNVVLMGDAVHTAHFSIGSGTKLAMEDAIALADAIREQGALGPALERYDGERKDEVARLQRTAETSLGWFEDTERYRGLVPVQFAISLLTRSKRITYENLKLRDEGFIAAVDRWFALKVRDESGLDLPLEPPPPPMFTPFRLRGMTLENRVVVSPMCEYSADDGTPNDWHLVHLGSRAIGGAGLVYAEMTNVSAEARISPGCTGLYKPEHMAAWQRIVGFVHANSRAKICMQLGHAGRKGSTRLSWEGDGEPLPSGNWPLLSASAIPYYPHSQVPRAMERADMERVRDDFVRAARWAEEAGFDMLELHMAHGYLLASFISPVTNRRQDAYGGALEGRMRFPLEVFDAVRAAWPEEKPMSVRISASDWIEGGLRPEDSVEVARLLKDHGCDLIDVSSGQTSPASEPVYGRMYQTPFADRIRHEVGMPTMAVGAITSADQVNTIIVSGRADLCALARRHLSEPYFTLHASAHYGFEDQAWPEQYLAAKDQAFRLAERAGEELAELRQAAVPEKPRAGGREAAE